MRKDILCLQNDRHFDVFRIAFNVIALHIYIFNRIVWHVMQID